MIGFLTCLVFAPLPFLWWPSDHPGHFGLCSPMFAYGDGKNQSPHVWFAMEVEELIVAIVMEEEGQTTLI